MRGPNGWRTGLWIKRSKFDPWLRHCVDIYGQDTLLSQCLPSPTCINGFQRTLMLLIGLASHPGEGRGGNTAIHARINPGLMGWPLGSYADFTSLHHYSVQLQPLSLPPVPDCYCHCHCHCHCLLATSYTATTTATITATSA